jgi:hypothetical protein
LENVVGLCKPILCINIDLPKKDPAALSIGTNNICGGRDAYHSLLRINTEEATGQVVV